MTTRIAKLFMFEAAHRLPNHDGKCRRPHGHTYRLEATFVGYPQEDGPKRGMVVDFGDISSVYRTDLEPFLDHRDLNDTLDVPETTAELIAEWAFNRFAAGGLEGVIERVRVWETQAAWAEYPA